MPRPWLACVLAGWLAVAAGCRSPATPDGAARPSLPALAGRIAPDAPAPRSLVGALSAEAQDDVQRSAQREGGATDEARLEAARAKLARFTVQIGEPGTSRPVVEGFALAEALASKPGPTRLAAAALMVVALETMALTVPAMLDITGLDPSVRLPRDPFLPFWEAVRKDGATQQAALAALVLRGSPPDALAIEVMRSAARSQPRDARPSLELRRLLQEEAIARESAASVEEWLDLGDTLVLLDQPGPARRALDRSATAAARARSDRGASDPAIGASQLAARRERLTGALGRLDAIQALAGATDVEARLRRASLLLDNQDLGDARAAYEQLRRELPRDARPVVGLARVRLWGATGKGVFESFLAAHELLRSAADLDHREGDYYGLSIGLAGFEIARALGEAQDPDKFKARALTLLATIESLNREYTRFAPERAAVLGFVLQSVRSELTTSKPGTIRERVGVHCIEGVTLAERYPNEADAFRLSLGCASLLEPPRAFEVASRPVPDSLRQDPTIAELRARVLVGLIARHRALDRLTAARAAVEALPSDTDAHTADRELLLADLTALAASGQAGASWPDAVAAYQRARSLRSKPDARLLNNLAIAHSATMTSPVNQVVVDLLKQAIALAPSDSDLLARANLSAIALAAGSAPDALDLLQPLLTRENPNAIVPLQAVAAGMALGQPDLVRAQTTAALEAIRPDNAAHGAFSRRVFVTAPGNFNFSLNTSASESAYVLRIGGHYDTLLLLPTPVRYDDLASRK